MRLFGVDLGKKRIGLAVMDLETALPRPLPALVAAGALAKDARQVVDAATRERAQAVVLGLPLLAGQESRMSAVVRRFGGEVEALGMPVHFVDESLTSSDADTAMFEAGLKASERKKRLDSESACQILLRFREAHAE